MTPTVSFAESLTDPSLFGPHFAGPSWLPWRSALKALFGQPMNAEELAIYSAHTGRQTPPTSPFREATFICGRRAGKSRALALAAVWLSLRDYSPCLSAGETATLAIIASDRRQGRVLLKYISGLFKYIPVLSEHIAREDAETLELNNGVVIEIHTGRIASPRGRTFIAVLCDEIAFWPTDDSAAYQDAEVIAAVRPGLASIPGSMLLIASSPYSRRGVLWDAYRKHYGRDDSKVLVWQAATLEMNPALDPAVVEDAYTDDSANAAAEYGGQFRTDVETFVSREVVDAATVPGRVELPYDRAYQYFAFTDPSGGSSDSFTLAIGHVETRNNANVAVIDAIRERRPPFSPDDVVRDFAATLADYGITSVESDRYGGEWPIERWREAGITCNPAAKPKSDLYRELLPLLNSGRVELLDNQRLHSQLCGLERRIARGGRDSIDHAPGQHDDIVNSVAGVCVRGAGKLTVLQLWEKLGGG